MTNNDLLRRLRYALKLDGLTISEICALAGHDIRPQEVLKLLKKDDEAGFAACGDETMGAFLDGLITYRRGRQDHHAGTLQLTDAPLTNNLILRKLRIALKLNDEQMLAILKLAEVRMSKPELSAMFRAVEHRNYKPCGDQFLRSFIRGLTLGQTAPQPGRGAAGAGS